MSRVLVTGATGTVGRQVVARLLDAGVGVRALSRRPEAARETLPASVEVQAGDLTDPESLDAPLRDVDAVFLLWTAPAAAVPGAVARIARRVRRVVFLSSPHQTPHPFFQQPNPMAALHAGIERELAAARLDTTMLRPGMFASNTAAWWGAQLRSGDVVRWPYAAANSAPVDVRDLAAVAALALVEDGHVGGDYVLTGPDSLSHAEEVATIGEVLGRRLRYEELAPDEFRAQLAAAKAPPAVADMLLDAWRAAVGIPAYVTSAVAELTGRPARRYRDWVADHAEAFGGGPALAR